eukprot:gene9945-9751_t
MPRNGSIDIPHVAVTDHYIRKRPMAEAEVSKITAFLGMKCYNNDHPDAITKARGFMEFYERYTPSASLLDSALLYIGKQADIESSQKQNRDFIRAWYLKNDFNKVISYATVPPANITDAWTAYRIGEAYYQSGRKENALPWYKRATEIWKFSLDFQNKYGTCLLALGKINEAKQVFEFIRSQNPNYVSANTNLGFIYMQQGNGTMAYDLLSRANELDPDHEQTLINLAVWHYGNKQYDKARKRLQHLLLKHPDNEQAKMMIADLDRIKLYLDLGTGINANTSLLGGGVDYHITQDISLNAGIGLLSTWGTKFYFGGKGYLKPCHKGWAFGAGATYNTGVSNIATKVETVNGQQLVELELLPQANIYASAYKYWGLGRGRKSRFYLQLGISRAVTQKKFNQLSGPPITSDAATIYRWLAPGGLIVGLGFSFGT